LAYLLHYLPPACQNQSAPWLAGEAIINQSSPTNFIKAAPSFHTSVHPNRIAFSVPCQWVSLFICPDRQALAIPLCYAGASCIYLWNSTDTAFFIPCGGCGAGRNRTAVQTVSSNFAGNIFNILKNFLTIFNLSFGIFNWPKESGAAYDAIDTNPNLKNCAAPLLR
jgi:hypothetical protein